MQPAPKGKDVLDVGLSIPNPTVGEETCAIIETGLGASGLELIITIGSRVVHSGSPPANLEVCFTQLPGEEGKAICVLVVRTSPNAAAPFAGTGGRTHS